MKSRIQTPPLCTGLHFPLYSKSEKAELIFVFAQKGKPAFKYSVTAHMREQN